MIHFTTRGKGQPPALMYYRGPVLVDPASAIEAGTGETEGLDPKGESAVPKADAKSPPKRPWITPTILVTPISDLVPGMKTGEMG